MKTKTYFIIALIFSLSLVVITQQACKKEDEPDPPNNKELSIPETTKVIDQNIWNSNFVGLDSSNYTITFKEELTKETPISVGDIVVSQDGYGYLRKVTNIQEDGNNIKVYTSFASLTEAIENGSFSFETVLSEQNIMRINYLKEGVILDRSDMKSTEETAMEYEIDTYLNNDKTVHLTGSFVLLPTVNAELVIKWFKVKKLDIAFVVDEQIDLKSTIELINIKYENEVGLAGVVFNSIIVMVGPVPVVIVPELELLAGVEFEVESTVTTSVTQSMNYTAGMLYENKDWTTYKELNKQLNYLPPSLKATAEAKAYIKPQMSLKFYGTVAPYLAGELYGRIEAELLKNPWWSLYAGVNIGAGVDMKIFGEELFNYYTNPPIIKYEVLIVDADAVGNQAPTLPTNPSPSNNAFDQSLNVDVTWECSDPDEDPLTYDIYFGESTNPGLVLSNSPNTTYDPGTLNENITYYWKIVAKDSLNHTTDGPVWQFTTNDGSNNEAPGLPSNPVPADQATDISTSTSLEWECTDPENNPLTFDIYFGTNNPPAIAETNQSSFSFNPGTLSESTQYYWKIVAKDNQGNQTEGVVWTFTTNNGSNNEAPGLPSNPVPADQATDISTSTSLEWECTDPENDPLTFDIYFGTNNPPAIAETDQSSFSFNPGNLSQSTQYYWKIVAKDDHDNQTEGPVWTFTTTGGGGTGTFTDPRDGQTYTTVYIGSQTWMAENLNYETTDYSWWYDNSSANGDVYGRLYTWDAALSACPGGWHLPSDEEWKTMEMALGMSQSEADNTGWRGTDEGGKMKETGTAHWLSPNTGATNSSGFTALPGGGVFRLGSFVSLSYNGYWWSSTEGKGFPWIRNMKWTNGQVNREVSGSFYGYSVRCLKN